jgi:hypothetical protein
VKKRQIWRTDGYIEERRKEKATDEQLVTKRD